MLRFYGVDSEHIEYLRKNGDEKYKILLRKELHYCNIDREKIKN